MLTVGPKVLAVIPAHNEAQRIAQVVAGTLPRLPVLVVDDGSTDGTAARAADAGAMVFRQTPNQGKGAALRAGFGYALAQGYDAVLTLDGDGQHDPADVPRLLAAYPGGADRLIIGARDFRRMPPARRLANAVGQRAFSWAVGQSVADNQSGYRLLPRPALEIMLACREPGFQFEVETIALCLDRGMGISWVPIRTIYGDQGSDIRPWRQLVEFSRMVWRIRQRRKRSARHRQLALEG